VKITVRCFAALAEVVGERVLELELPEGATVRSVLDRLTRDIPAFGDHASRLMTAVNRDYVKPEACLSDGDELALFPPVSGG
jgi:molybdopterin converting factor subunit 1